MMNKKNVKLNNDCRVVSFKLKTPTVKRSFYHKIRWR